MTNSADLDGRVRARVGPVRVQRVGAGVVRPVRRAVLRPERPAEDSNYAADDSAVHLAAYDAAGTVLGVATVFAQEHPVTGEPAWRLRGMAVAPEHQGNGIGGALLSAVLDQVRTAGGTLIWCNARVPALTFYTRYGFTIDSDVFLVAGRDHRRMRRQL